MLNPGGGRWGSVFSVENQHCGWGKAAFWTETMWWRWGREQLWLFYAWHKWVLLLCGLVRRFRGGVNPCGLTHSLPFPSWLSCDLIRGWVSLWSQVEIRGRPEDTLWGEAGGPEESGVHVCTLCCFSCVLLSPHEKPSAGWLPGSRSSWWPA